MEKMDHHRWNPPLDELQLIAETVGISGAEISISTGVIFAQLLG
jgi:hypothetical protein